MAGWIEGALLISRFAGRIDIRQKGSGNVGASNVTNVLGWRYGAIVALIDIAKAFIPITLARVLFSAPFTLQFLVGFGVIIGHIYPLPFQFKGGKGIASLIGMCLALDWRLGLVMGALLIVITLVFDYIFIASLTLYTLFPIALAVTDRPTVTTGLAVILGIVGYVRHRSNIRALKNGEEVGLRAVIKKHRP